MKKIDSDLMFTCSLIEYIGREQKLRRGDVVRYLGEKNISRIFKYADVLHCEPIAKVADEYIEIADISKGDYDNIKKCKYNIPDYWTIGEVFKRLILDVSGNNANIVEKLIEVYSSWITDIISDYNSDFFYQPRDYIKECYLSKSILI